MKSILPLLAVNFVGALGLSLVMPFLVVLVEEFGGNGVVYGLMAAAYPAFQLIGSPVLGRWSDRLGRRPVLLLSQAGTAAAWIVFYIALVVPTVSLFSVDSSWLGAVGVTVPLVVLFAARALDGLTGGNVSVANALLADISTADTRGRNFGLMGISSNLGFILGPTLSGILGATALGVRLPVIAAFSIAIVGLVLIVAFLPPPSPRRSATPPRRPADCSEKIVRHCPHAATTSTDDMHANGLSTAAERGLRVVLRLPNVALFLVLYFVLFLGFNIFYAVFPVHALRMYGWTTAELGVFYSTLSFVMLAVQGPVLRFLSTRVSEVGRVTGGSAVLALCFVILIFADGRWAFAAAVLFAVGNGVMWPSFLAMLSSLVSAEHQGEVQGYGTSAGSAASLIGLVAGGVLYESVGATAFAISGIAFLGVAILGIRLRQPPRERDAESVSVSRA